jgi:ribosomal protein S25
MICDTKLFEKTFDFSKSFKIYFQALPGKVPLDVFNSISALLDKSEEDEISLVLAEKILQELKSREIVKSSSSGPNLPTVSDLQKWLLDPDSVLRKSLSNENLRNQVVPKIGVISAKFGSRLLHRVSNRLESRLNSFETTRSSDSSSSPGGTLGDAFNGKTIVKSVAGLSISSARNVAKALENSNNKNQKQLSQLGP